MMFLLLALIPALALAQTTADLTVTIDGVFDALDYDFDNEIARDELTKFFQTYDANHDNRISRADYTAAIDENFPNETHDPIITNAYRNLFDVLDNNKNGFIEPNDLDAVFRNADDNNNGVVTRAEFHKYFNEIFIFLVLG
uniref:EF-hand domain-containing protein n=1 Tax=Biomphalaria glabrata TaxID=6526 RepID=A0A2C9LQT7_BIOGL